MLLSLAILATADAAPNERRFGLFVGNNHGDSNELRLMFAQSDAKKMRDLFVQYGGIAGGDAILLQEGTKGQVEKQFKTLASRIAAAEAQGASTSFVFYYSGHGDDDGLHLGTATLAHDDLRSWIDASNADVRIAMLDACQSGSVIRQKGGTRGQSFDFALEVERARGTAVLTSSAASEFSQESSQVGGGFFTYYLHSGLLGAADDNRDGIVTLTEAYGYVHAETSFGTRETTAAQTPSFDFDLVGSGDVPLTTLEAASAYLNFLGALEGTFAVWDESRKRYVAEIEGADPGKLALRPGTYYVHRRQPGWVDEAEYHVRRGETLTVFEEDFVSVSYEDTAAKGDIDRQVRRASLPDLSFRFSLGARTFGDNSVAGQRYVPAHSIGGIEARFLPRRRGPYVSFDLLTGGGSGTLSFEQIGDMQVGVSSTSLGAVAGFATGPKFVRAGFGGRAEFVAFRRSFPAEQAENQTTLAVAPGFNTWLGIHHGRFSLDFQWNWQLLTRQWDGKFNGYSSIMLTSGYRF